MTRRSRLRLRWRPRRSRGLSLPQLVPKCWAKIALIRASDRCDAGFPSHPEVDLEAVFTSNDVDGGRVGLGPIAS